MSSRSSNFQNMVIKDNDTTSTNADDRHPLMSMDESSLMVDDRNDDDNRKIGTTTLNTVDNGTGDDDVDDDDPADKRGKNRKFLEQGIHLLRRMVSDVSQTAMAASTATSGPTTGSSSSSNSATATKPSVLLLIQTLSTIGWILFGICGWYIPRHILDQKYDQILAKKPPYQLVSNGNNGGSGSAIILDFLLNNPVIDPPTVDGTMLKQTSIVVPVCIMIFYTTIILILHPPYPAQKQWQTERGRLLVLFTKWYCTVCTVLSAFSTAIGISEGTTVMIKQWVQRRRPNFYQLCGFSTQTLSCSTDPSMSSTVVEAQLSFPSGHSSLVACGMTFLSLYLHHTYYILAVRKTQQQQSAATNTTTTTMTLIQFFVKTLCPFWYALFVAASRVVDYWHHPSDIVAGLLLGTFSAYITFQFWFGLPLSSSSSSPPQLTSSSSSSSPLTSTHSTIIKSIGSSPNTSNNSTDNLV